ncbi:hypothetical protein MXB_621, partial [Myxobolus squamalis]
DEYFHVFLTYENFLGNLAECIEIESARASLNSEKLVDRLKKIKLFIKLCRNKVYHISNHAYLYDFDEKTRANGYRFHVKIFDKIIARLQICVSKIKSPTSSIIDSKVGYIKELKQWEIFLVSIYPTFCAASKLIEINPSSLFLDPRHSLNNILINNFPSFIHEVFYGQLFGFQFNYRLKTIFSLIASSMVSHAKGFDLTSNKLLRAFIEMGNNSLLLLNPDKRSPKLKEIYSFPTIEFCKSFMSLTEAYGLQYIPAIIGPNMNINRFVKLKVQKLLLKSRERDEDIILIDDSVLSNLVVDKPIMAHLISYYFYEGQSDTFKASIIPPSKIEPNSENLIIFIHGGGFVALSSSSCEMFLRNWAVSVRCPIFSINYSLSPEAVFPQAIEECFYAYCWCIVNSLKIGSTGSKILLVGDSAGANLILAITQLAISKGIRIPDGLVCIYPSCYMAITSSPSRILSIIDTFLSCGFLYAARNAYFNIHKKNNEFFETKLSTQRPQSSIISEIEKEPVPIRNFFKNINMDSRSYMYYQTDDEKIDSSGDNPDLKYCKWSDSEQLLYHDPSQDPLASPLLASPEVLKKFPSVRLLLADMDPLLDDGIEFAKKLLANNVDVKLDVVSDLPHGFLQLCSVTPESQVASEIVVSRLNEILCKI